MEKARIEHILSQHLTREDARALLKHGQGDEGEYLFRASQSAPGAVVLSMCHDGQLHSFQIQREGPLYVTPNKLTFPTLIVSVCMRVYVCCLRVCVLCLCVLYERGEGKAKNRQGVSEQGETFWYLTMCSPAALCFDPL